MFKGPRDREWLRQAISVLAMVRERACIIDRGYRHLYANSAFLGHLGLAREELEGRSLVDLYGAELFEGKLRPRIDAAFAFPPGEGATVFSLESGLSLGPIVHPSGEVRALVMIMEDRAAIRVAQEALAESERRFRTIVDALPQFVSFIDRDLVYRFANRTYLDFFKVDTASLIGRRVPDLIGPKAFLKVAGSIERVLAGERVDYLEHLEYPDRKACDIEGSLIPARSAEGKVEGYYAVLMDVTAWVEAQEALKRGIDEKEVLIRELFHRTRNNMQVVQAMVNLRSAGLTDPEALAAFAEVESMVGTMALVHGTLYRSGDLSHLCLRDFLFSVIGLVKGVVGCQEGIEVAVRGEDFPVLMDVAMPLGLAVHELLSNALRHGFKGRARGRVDVEVASVGAHGLVLVFSDDGVGLPPGFDPERDSGIGLKLAFGLLREQLGGTISIQSPPGLSLRVEIDMSRFEARV